MIAVAASGGYDRSGGSDPCFSVAFGELGLGENSVEIVWRQLHKFTDQPFEHMFYDSRSKTTDLPRDQR